MALEYTLYIETNLNSEQVLQLMFAGMGIQADIERLDKSTVFLSTSGPGFITYASKTGAQRRSFLMEELGIESSVSILFRLDKFRACVRSIDFSCYKHDKQHPVTRYGGIGGLGYWGKDL